MPKSILRIDLSLIKSRTKYIYLKGQIVYI